MKLIAVRACPACARAGFLSIFLLLGGCGALPLPDKPVRPQPYDLGPALPQAASAAPSGPALALGRVDAPPAIDGSNIVYRLMYSDAGQQPRPYALARWVMSPPQLVAERLRETLAAARPVVEPGLGLARVTLDAELQEFAQNFSAPGTSEGVVQLRVTVTAPGAASERLLGQRSFVARKPAPSADAAGGAQALRQATDDVVAQVVAWVNGLPAPR